MQVWLLQSSFASPLLLPTCCFIALVPTPFRTLIGPTIDIATGLCHKSEISLSLPQLSECSTILANQLTVVCLLSLHLTLFPLFSINGLTIRMIVSWTAQTACCSLHHMLGSERLESQRCTAHNMTLISVIFEWWLSTLVMLSRLAQHFLNMLWYLRIPDLLAIILCLRLHEIICSSWRSSRWFWCLQSVCKVQTTRRICKLITTLNMWKGIIFLATWWPLFSFFNICCYLLFDDLFTLEVSPFDRCYARHIPSLLCRVAAVYSSLAIWL